MCCLMSALALPPCALNESKVFFGNSLRDCDFFRCGPTWLRVDPYPEEPYWLCWLEGLLILWGLGEADWKTKQQHANKQNKRKAPCKNVTYTGKTEAGKWFKHIKISLTHAELAFKELNSGNLSVWKTFYCDKALGPWCPVCV